MISNHTKNILKASITLGIISLLLIPATTVYAADRSPPSIDYIFIDPSVYVGPLSTSYYYAECQVTDDGTLTDVRVIITGPNSYSLNESMEDAGFNYYYYYFDVLPSYGTYVTHIWVIDSEANQITSEPYYTIVIENPMPYVHVDDSNTAGPWDGTLAHPFLQINHGTAAVTSGGTVFVHNGNYPESLWLGYVNVIGESKENVIVYSPGNQVITMQTTSNVTVSNLTLEGSHYCILSSSSNHIAVTNCIIRNNDACGFLFGDTWNVTITGCTFQNNLRGLWFYTPSGSMFIYHNNFIQNTNQVAMDASCSNIIWDNGVTGNYWSNYRTSYPNAHIVPSTGTWDTAYTIGNVNDHHPWVYPNGYIDNIPPQVSVIAPNGGETLVGETTISWTASDDLTSNLSGTIGISYSADAGATWHLISQELANEGSIAWDTNSVSDGTQYLVKVNASDEFQNIGFDVSDDVFTIMNHPNQPPETPDAPSGPTTGYIDTMYTYVTNEVVDPNGDTVWYWFDWDDGTNSGWVEEPSASHSWAAAGTYDVTVKAKDTSDEESGVSEALSVVISEIPEEPVLVIESITGGFGITAVIRNNGSVDATNVTWSIVLNGGFIIRGSNVTDVIDSIPAGEEAIISSGLILGLGRTTITVSTTCDEGVSAEKTASGFVLLFFVLGVQ